jgi:hypothetical protein
MQEGVFFFPGTSVSTHETIRAASIFGDGSKLWRLPINLHRVVSQKTAMHMAFNIFRKLHSVRGSWQRLRNNNYTLVVLTGVKAVGT